MRKVCALRGNRFKRPESLHAGGITCTVGRAVGECRESADRVKLFAWK